ncbi:TetR/AcrR family transcriptional regulator [Methanothermobacter thermautotrophicus]|uniref:TetR/AcrR family transcriptional regulator n=2 Tax=Methanothermobacter thermautotrophicus TaxID=145262 RepID=A0A842YNX4_METTF|nr:TetR/AcrR family transcriptional regulator [Methanothermobacter thermautotrophicus]
MLVSAYMRGIMVSTENRITDAARELFIKKGYRGTTTREIASRAGVSEVTVFRKFGSKKNLLKRIMDESIERISPALQVLEGDGEPRDVLEEVSQQLVRVMVREKIDLLFVMMVERELEEHGFEEWEIPDSAGRLIYDSIEGYLRKKIREGSIRAVDPGTVAEMMISYISHASLSSHFRGHETPAAGRFIDILWEGIGGGGMIKG